MFPFKKKQSQTTEEETDNVAKKGIKTMDTVVTGMILGGIIASIYWVKKLREKNNSQHDNHHDH